MEPKELTVQSELDNQYQKRLVGLYRIARDWWRSQDIRDAARAVGLDERAYCDSFVHSTLARIPMTVVSNSSNGAPIRLVLDYDRAFSDAEVAP